MILLVKLNKHLLEVIKPDKLTYRHALLVAMPIELLQVLVQYNALADYVDCILSLQDNEYTLDKLVSRKDNNQRVPKYIRYEALSQWNPSYYLAWHIACDDIQYLYDQAITKRIYN